MKTYEYAPFEDLLGKTIVSIEKNSTDVPKYLHENDNLVFKCSDGTTYVQTHDQDCCEGVFIEDIIGDLNELIGTPVLLAEETSNYGDTEYGQEEWTFYKLATNKGYATIRWYGESNGYYSTGTEFYKLLK